MRIPANGAEAQSGKGILSNTSQQINISKGGVQNKNKHMGQVQPTKGTAYLLKAVAVDKYSCSHQGNKAFVGQQHQQRVGSEIEGRQYQHHSKNSHQQGWSENLPNGFALIKAKEAQQNTADTVEQNAVMA